MAKNASIFIKLGRKVALIMFFANHLDNGHSHGHSGLQNAKYIDFFVKKYCLMMESFRENGKCYRKSDLIFWKPRKFPLKTIHSDFYLLIVFREQFMFKNAELSFFANFRQFEP